MRAFVLFLIKKLQKAIVSHGSYGFLSATATISYVRWEGGEGEQAIKHVYQRGEKMVT